MLSLLLMVMAIMAVPAMLKVTSNSYSGLEWNLMWFAVAVSFENSDPNLPFKSVNIALPCNINKVLMISDMIIMDGS